MAKKTTKELALEKKIRVVELFAGVGGFRLGLEGVHTDKFSLDGASTNFETVWANQWEPGKARQHAVTIYRNRFGEKANMVNEDVATQIANVPAHELLVGGFPCQDYSVAHTGAQGIQGKKGVLWWSIDGIIKAQHPPYVLLENVDRLIKSPASKRGRDFGIILRCLQDEGYAVEWRVINAAEYGQGQRRRRIFIFAYHNSTPYYARLKKSKDAAGIHALRQAIYNDGFFAKVFPVEASLSNKDIGKHAESDISPDKYADLEILSNEYKAQFYSSGVVIDGLICSLETTPKYETPIPLLENMEKDEVEARYFLGANLKNWEYLKGSKSIERVDKKTGYKYNFTEGPVAFPDAWDKPSRTMLTSESSVNRSTHVVEDFKTKALRLLTPIECERLNGFPPGWTGVESVPEKFRYFAMGNALVVPLIKRMGVYINEIINGDASSTPPVDKELCRTLAELVSQP